MRLIRLIRLDCGSNVSLYSDGHFVIVAHTVATSVMEKHFHIYAARFLMRINKLC